VHGITDEMVADAPVWESVLGDLDWLLSGNPVVVWNAEFDLSAINGQSERLHLPSFPGPWECAMKAYGAFAGELSTQKWAKPGELKYWKQDDAAAKHGIERGGHRAAADADVCRRIVLAMAGVEG
jgi:DNA polymerase-3 subunit epsilon